MKKLLLILTLSILSFASTPVNNSVVKIFTTAIADNISYIIPKDIKDGKLDSKYGKVSFNFEQIKNNYGLKTDRRVY